MRKPKLIGFLAALSLSTLCLGAENWPKWLGPRGDGISRETMPDQWPAQPKMLWKANVGTGYSSPIGVDGRIYLLTMIDKKDHLICFDAESGKVIWDQANSGGYTGDFPGTRAAPEILDGRIYTYSGDGQLVCRDVADGKEIWSTNVLKETGAQNLNWGVASAPLIIGDMIYVQNGRGNGVPVAVGVNKTTGKIAWKSQAAGRPSGGIRKWPQGGGYAQVILVDVEGTKQLIVFGSDMLYGISPEDGRTIWSEQWVTDWDVNGAVPLFKDGYLFITSDYNKGCMMLKLSPTGAKKEWENREVMSRFQPVILDGGYMYANSEGSIKCLAWPSGKVQWTAKIPFKPGMGGSLVRVGDKLVSMGENGILALLKATPQGVQQLSRVDVFRGQQQIWATPLIYNGRIYCKGTSELVCLEMK